MVILLIVQVLRIVIFSFMGCCMKLVYFDFRKFECCFPLVAAYLAMFSFVTEVQAEVSTHVMADFEAIPISIQEFQVSPQIIINASQDHQLFFKAYNDYSDLDGDEIPETTYKHSVDYYGYFDSNKCYDYDSVDQRFEPVAVTADKYCAGINDAFWSGNFLNWASMTRIDAIRKILFGGHRRVDTSTDTVLERAFIPPDIHAFAKYYNGTDVDDLTPFTPYETEPSGASTSPVFIGTESKSFNTNQSGNWIEVGDYVSVTDHSNPSNYMEGWVTSFDSTDGNPLTVDVKYTGGAGFISNWDIVNHTRAGITICNVTYSSANAFSQDITDPPLLRVAEGNYTFWSAGEVHQCLWEEEDPGNNGKNYNDPFYSDIYAAQDNPLKSDVGLGLDDYVVRVQVCFDADGDGILDLKYGEEKCKQYPNGNLKPIGLLQKYGDSDDLLFGMIAGTYGKATRGGDMVQKIFNSDGMNGMCREINLGRDCNGDGDIDGGTDTGFVNQDDWLDGTHALGDGTFKRVYSGAGGPITHPGKSEGIINTWSLFRIYGYDYRDWDYSTTSAGGDKCPLSVDFFGDTAESECHNWGNPFAEIYLSGLRYFAGNNSPTSYQSGDGQFIEGINYNTGSWFDPLNSDNYCSQLNVVNFNSSVISVDTVFDSDPAQIKDELDTSAFGIIPDLDSTLNSKELTDIIGDVEGISDPGTSWFIGESSDDQDRRCTAKTITSLGETRGLCPFGPDLRGGFRIAGLAWYAHTHDIRPETLTGGRGLEGYQRVDSYAVRLAAGNPIIEIPTPAGAPVDKVTLIPSCITNNKNDYGCTMVDFKIVEPHSEVGGVGRGKYFVIWEDSLQGNDYDLDAGGIIEYEISASEITITTAVTLENLGYAIGHGYVISGTNQDGLHIHSGTNSFDYNDPTTIAGCVNCYGLMGGGSSSQRTYTLGTSTAGLLEDPLWYAAKYGGFEDINDNNLPDLQSEWDVMDNRTGESLATGDGIPDNYYYASHPQQLEESLDRVFGTILERTSSGTAAAVVSNNVRGEGALYQAFYEPLKKDTDDNQAKWIGTVHSLWTDSFGYSRQDCQPTDNIAFGECNPNGILDNYLVDQVVQTFFDESEERTRVKVFTSDNPDSFSPYSMEGVVTAYSTGAVSIVPYSMEGVVANYDNMQVTMHPYSMTGIVDSYDSDSGAITVTMQAGTLRGNEGDSFDNWYIYNATSLLSGRYLEALALSESNTYSFVIDPGGAWISAGDKLNFYTYNLIGEAGNIYDNWFVECLAGVNAESSIAHSVALVNRGELIFSVQDDLFTGCTQVKISTSNIIGTEGNSYSDWNVSNLATAGNGDSLSPITLTNYGVTSFNVTPTLDWIKEGDRLLISNYQFIDKDIYEVGYLWNAREQLYLEGLTDAEIKSNRLYSANASTGRHIMTWIDKDLDGQVHVSEYVEFEESLTDYGFFDVASQADADNLVNYIRGVEVSGYRSRSVRYGSGENVQIMRLGDVIHSTPTVVSSPQEAFNILYKDSTYTAFRKQYADRRVMVYVGSNDGLLHAFNGGFYGEVKVDASGTVLSPADSGYSTAETKVAYLTSGNNGATGEAAIEHPLGSEIWAYAPMNLLPHLKWLKDPNYTHVYYVDGKPRVFDAKIFSDDVNHPNGWGTVMVVGMRLGGGQMTIDTAADGLGLLAPPNTPDANDVTMSSAYMIFDITNPEVQPTLLGEIQVPDGSFSFVYPTAMVFGNDSWYLIFGSGPDDIDTVASSSTAKMYVLNLKELTTDPGGTVGVPTGCSLDSVASSAMKLITCDTGVNNMFMGSPVSVDWDLDYYADTAYFGLVGDATASSGAIMRFAVDENSDPDNWLFPTTFMATNQPVNVSPALGYDNFGNKWVYFGTGRFFTMDDKISTAIQSIYGVKDDGSGTVHTSVDLLDATNIDIFTDESIDNGPNGTVGGTPITNFTDLIYEVDEYLDGWYLDLPPIVGTAGVAPSTRVLGQPALTGGILFSSVFQPSGDPCAGEGYSRLYGLYYKTGTTYPSPTIFGTETVSDSTEVKYKALKFVDLGRGMSTSPAIHSGYGTGDGTVSVFTQLSTGDIFRQSADTALKVRSGKTSWRELVDY